MAMLILPVQIETVYCSRLVIHCVTRKRTQKSIRKQLYLSALVRTAIKALKQAVEMKHELSA